MTTYPRRSFAARSIRACVAPIRHGFAPLTLGAAAFAGVAFAAAFGAAAFAGPAFVGGPGAAATRHAGLQFEGPAADEVREREIAFAQTMADRDLEAFLGFVHPEAVFFNGGTALRGRDAIQADWARHFEGATAPFSWRPDTVQVLDSGGLALTSGPVVAASGEVVGRFNSIWRKDPAGTWRVVFDKGS